jgi:hypothetical protein
LHLILFGVGAQFLLHPLFKRSLELREKGPGFDALGASGKKK